MSNLQLFRLQLLGDVRELLASAEGRAQKQWLKNGDVRKLLKVSSNTVQRLRTAGKLKSSKLGGCTTTEWKTSKGCWIVKFKTRGHAGKGADMVL